MLKVFITNLSKYTRGELIGEWVSLPISDKDLQKVFDRIGLNNVDTEYLLSDYITDIDGFKVKEHDNLEKLNEIAEIMADMNETELEIIKTLLGNGYNINEVLEKIDDCTLYNDCYDMRDVAYQYADEVGLFDDLPDWVETYFNFEAYGRDLKIKGEYYFTEKGNCVCVN